MCPRTISIISIMRSLCNLVMGLWFLGVLATPVEAHQVVLKNGRVIQFEKYRVTEQLLLYVDNNGKEVGVPLSEIDLDHTRELSATDTEPLVLPGLVHSPPDSNSNTQPTLGDMARNLRKKDAGATSKRVFTNDDVASAPSDTAGSSPIQQSDPDTWRDRIDSFKTTIAPFETLPPDELARAVLGNLDCDFPGRRGWEENLASQKDAVVTSLQRASRQFEEFYLLRDVLKRSTSISKGDEEKLTRAREAAESAINEARIQQGKFESVIEAGKQRALEWKRK